MPSETCLDEYREAFRELYRERALKGVRVHVIVYLIGCVAMVTVNLALTPRIVWAVLPVICWGAGVCAHYLLVRRIARSRLPRLEEEALRRVRGP
ncbi:2TM domain-containing protein [Methanopyrus sp.]